MHPQYLVLKLKSVDQGIIIINGIAWMSICIIFSYNNHHHRKGKFSHSLYHVDFQDYLATSFMRNNVFAFKLKTHN